MKRGLFGNRRSNSRPGFCPINLLVKPKRSNSRRGFNKYNIFAKPLRSQQTMGLPFGVIFSIILIVVFIVIAFIAIRHFLDIEGCAGVGQFYEELQRKVDEAWVSQSSEFDVEINLPGGIDKVCFADLNVERTGSQED